MRPADCIGRPTRVFFGFGWFQDARPITLGDISGWLEEPGSESELLKVVLISVDPERDTPEVLADYLSDFDPRSIGLTGPVAEIERAGAGFRAKFERVGLLESARGQTLDLEATVGPHQ